MDNKTNAQIRAQRQANNGLREALSNNSNSMFSPPPASSLTGGKSYPTIKETDPDIYNAHAKANGLKK